MMVLRKGGSSMADSIDCVSTMMSATSLDTVSRMAGVRDWPRLTAPQAGQVVSGPG